MRLAILLTMASNANTANQSESPGTIASRKRTNEVDIGCEIIQVKYGSNSLQKPEMDADKAATPAATLPKDKSKPYKNDSPGKTPKLTLVSMRAEMNELATRMEKSMDTKLETMKSSLCSAIANAVQAEMSKFKEKFDSELSTVNEKVKTLDESNKLLKVKVDSVSELVQSLQPMDEAASQRLNDMETSVKGLKDTVQYQQKFLDLINGERRMCNIIVSGLTEYDKDAPNTEIAFKHTNAKTDMEKANLLMQVIEAYTVKISKVHRLGEVSSDPDPKPRLLKVTLEESSDRRLVLKNAIKLKDAGVPFSSIYLNKDMHPRERKEMKK